MSARVASTLALDARRDSDGVWHIRAGARVQVVLSVTNPQERYHVTLTDRLPAGLEVSNTELRGTSVEDITRTQPRQNWCEGDLPPVQILRALPDPFAAEVRAAGAAHHDECEHQELRDDRVEYSCSYLDAGWRSRVYTARATTRGTFLAPGPLVEETYTPDIFGAGATDRIVVE